MKLWIKYNAGVDNFAHFVENLVKTVDKPLFSVEKPVEIGFFGKPCYARSALVAEEGKAGRLATRKRLGARDLRIQ